MDVLILGANGMMGPSVVKSLEDTHNLRLTDINSFSTPHEYFQVDVSNIDQVLDAADGMDAIINLSVLRLDRTLAFDVNARGCYNVMMAAVQHGIKRVINSGPFYAVAGPTYERFDHDIGPDIPHQPGTYLYAITKSLGQEICNVFTQTYDIHVMDLLFYMLVDGETRDMGENSPIASIGRDMVPYTTSWRDTGEAFRCALEVDVKKLPSKCEMFFVFPDLPHQKFSNCKARSILGWEPKDNLVQFWKKNQTS